VGQCAATVVPGYRFPQHYYHGPFINVVPVKGHWPSSRFCVTLSTVGVARIDCSDMREKPSNSPPHPAKSRSMPTKAIINLVGMLAVLRLAA
jgi:hypothetical protein